MTPYYADQWLTVYAGDCRNVLPTLEAESVDCIVTSPPYWGLRDYGTATWAGGNKGCDHLEKVGGTDSSTLGEASGGHAISDEARVRSTTRSFVPYRHTCGKCGATRQDSQLGLEPTPEEYVVNLVAVFRELRRVLKPSGTCWLNLGDSYSSGGERGVAGRGATSSLGKDRFGDRFDPSLQTIMRSQSRAGSVDGLKPKDLVGIPWRVAFALQADGWYLRSDIIWSKPNPMPESVTDRPTKAHEYLFLLTKAAHYYYDAEAVREPNSEWSVKALEGRWHRSAQNKNAPERNDAESVASGVSYAERVNPSGRNLRSVWTIASRPYPGAHFAVFPPELPERCIKAGSPQDGVVLDPFAGSGTVGMVAQKLNRRAILIDLNPTYVDQQMKRNAQTPLGLAG